MCNTARYIPFVMLIGCGAPLERHPSTKEDFLAAYKTAYERGDVDSLVALVAWDDVPTRLRQQQIRLLTNYAGRHTITSIHLIEYENDDSTPIVIDGREVLPNLRPLFWLEVTTSGHQGFDGGESQYSIKAAVGRKGEWLMFCGPTWSDSESVSGDD